MISRDARLLDEIRTIDVRDPSVDIGVIEPLILRTPTASADLLREVARAEGLSVNALVHVLADLALDHLGLPTIRDRAPRVANYLSRTRRQPRASATSSGNPPRPADNFSPAALRGRLTGRVRTE